MSKKIDELLETYSGRAIGHGYNDKMSGKVDVDDECLKFAIEEKKRIKSQLLSDILGIAEKAKPRKPEYLLPPDRVEGADPAIVQQDEVRFARNEAIDEYHTNLEEKIKEYFGD